MVTDEKEKENLNTEIVQIIEDCFPNGVDFCKVIEYYHNVI